MVLCPIVLVSLVVSGALIRFGSLRGGLAWYTGKFLTIDNPRKSFGTGELGGWSTVTFNLTNFGPEPIRVVGFRASCSCIMPERLPMSLAAGQSTPFRVKIHHLQESDKSEMPMLIYTNIARQPELLVWVTGKVERNLRERTADVNLPGGGKGQTALGQ